MTPIRKIQEQHGIVGRDDELAMALAVLDTGRHLLLEGPVGVGKTTVALAVCAHLGRPTVRVDGDDRYSEARLTGWFDPPLVLEVGYGEASFIAGPLVEAMRTGAVLFINELNRMPETVQNVLLPALDERRIGVPHLGEVVAADGFQVIATQNPVEYIATGHLSEALRDRFEHLPLSYQPEAEEIDIVAGVTGAADAGLVTVAVRIARATRIHPRFRKGASVRAAIAMVLLAERLAAGRPEGIDRSVMFRAAMAALATRVELRDDQGADLATVLDELLGQAGPVSGDGGPPSGTDDDTGSADDDADTDDEDDAVEGARKVYLQVADEADEPGGEGRSAEESADDGWRLAVNLSAGVVPDEDALARARAERLAVGAVLRRAAAIVGPLRGATRLVRGPEEQPGEGELDLEATLDNIVGKPRPDPGDWIVERRIERRRQVVLMIDGSGSMRGENMALAAVAAAVLALKLHVGDLSVITFSDAAQVLVRLGEQVPAGEAVRRLLEVPCIGSTNIASALVAGADQLAGAGDPRCAAVLVSDGLYTTGPDPRKPAGRFGSLHVLHTSSATEKRGNGGIWIAPWRQVGRDVAERGGGRVVEVSSFDELPRRMVDLADHILR